MPILAIIGGLIVGSFFSVLVSRLDKKSGIVSGRSECPKCSAVLKWYDLIPILSFVFLRGKCGYCHEKISLVYPAIELTTAAAFFLFYIKRPLPWDIFAAYDLILLGAFVLIIFFDYLFYIIPDKVVLPLIVLSICFGFFYRNHEFINLLTSGLLLGGFFAILHIVSKGEWVGFGDAKLSLLIGLAFGYPSSFLITVSSVWTATLLGLLLIAIRKATLKSALPFGLFLALFSIIFIIFKDETQIFKYLFY
ncbi:MAG: hypothetical protein A3J46_04395 [Candidatus Yanofskybacteria bacterium RIFCSPHIGHO2_02_FULL_41_11]|uniref:Prepilin peptidase n=1 Tax=Candidatus Yanofskybacteria bacterium RIFCSPHIGHO2_02_FULL_41_11 TaxID=1802675 RepID=A0A1F8F891_9BACT|nr:MAG: hypothetical protein A3J46_04395 [Candidatus Yanofskybacteria bacterium RIFCSPHIGHO2_02_FULL_41_11]